MEFPLRCILVRKHLRKHINTKAFWRSIHLHICQSHRRPSHCVLKNQPIRRQRRYPTYGLRSNSLKHCQWIHTGKIQQSRQLHFQLHPSHLHFQHQTLKAITVQLKWLIWLGSGILWWFWEWTWPKICQFLKRKHPQTRCQTSNSSVRSLPVSNIRQNFLLRLKPIKNSFRSANHLNQIH